MTRLLETDVHIHVKELWRDIVDKMGCTGTAMDHIDNVFMIYGHTLTYAQTPQSKAQKL